MKTLDQIFDDCSRPKETKLRALTESDWKSFSGCSSARPWIADLECRTGGNVLVDGKDVNVYLMDGLNTFYIGTFETERGAWLIADMIASRVGEEQFETIEALLMKDH